MDSRTKRPSNAVSLAMNPMSCKTTLRVAIVFQTVSIRFPCFNDCLFASCSDLYHLNKRSLPTVSIKRSLPSQLAIITSRGIQVNEINHSWSEGVPGTVSFIESSTLNYIVCLIQRGGYPGIYIVNLKYK